MTRRFLALHLPRLATDLIRRTEPELPRGAPLVTWRTAGPRRVLAAVDEAATAAGLRPEQALADAQAIMPDLALRPANPADEARALHALALWTRRYTPLTAADPPDGLLLDITGCDHLLGDEAALLRDALARLRHTGFAAQGAVAGPLPLLPPWPAPGRTTRSSSLAQKQQRPARCRSARRCACPCRCWKTWRGWGCAASATWRPCRGDRWRGASARRWWIVSTP